MIKSLPESRWKEYRNLRLESLRNDPLAYGIAIEDEINLSEEEWRSRISNCLFAFDENRIIGMISFKYEELTKMKHIAWINDVYVKTEYRGKGIGSMLMEEAIRKIKKNPGIEKIKLIADPVQRPAINM